MRIDILTVIPEIFEGPFQHSILKRAQEKGLVKIQIHNIRDYSTHRQKSVDDYQYGGGAGMVMTIQPIADCIEKAFELYIRIRAFFMTLAYISICKPNWFPLQGALQASEQILGHIACAYDGRTPPVQFLVGAWAGRFINLWSRSA